MANEFFNQLHLYLVENLPFVAYRKPTESTISAFLQENPTLHYVDNYEEKGIVFAPFDASEKALLIPYASSRVLLYDYADEMTNFDSPITDRYDVHDETEKDKHIELVQKAIDAIENRGLQKVVVSRRENISLPTIAPIDLFKRILSKYPSAFVYIWYHPKRGMWLGATPETLMKVEGNHLTTMSLAGTKRFEGEESIVWNQKEKQEQQFVTDFIVSKLGSLGCDIKVSPVETVRAGNLLHLKTTVEAKFKPGSLNFNELLQQLHPTPAVCGLPKESAKQFILNNETYNREFYTGFLGELNLTQSKTRNPNRRNLENNAYATVKTVSNLYVNLRCMKIVDNQVNIYVGGGITLDSDPQKEWEETVSKSHVIKSIL